MLTTYKEKQGQATIPIKTFQERELATNGVAKAPIRAKLGMPKTMSVGHLLPNILAPKEGRETPRKGLANIEDSSRNLCVCWAADGILSATVGEYC